MAPGSNVTDPWHPLDTARVPTAEDSEGAENTEGAQLTTPAHVKGHGPRGAPLNLGHYGTAVEVAVAVARHLQAVEEAAMEEESEEDELEIKEDEVEIEVEDEEVAEQPVPEEQPGPLPDPPPPQQLPGQPPGLQPESPPQLEVEEQPLPQRPNVALGVAVGVAVLTLGQRLVQLESRLIGTDAPQGTDVLQRIKTLEANLGVTATGSMPERIAVLEATAAEWFV